MTTLSSFQQILLEICEFDSIRFADTERSLCKICSLNAGICKSIVLIVQMVVISSIDLNTFFITGRPPFVY